MGINYWDNEVAALRIIERNQNNRTTFYSKEQTETYIQSQSLEIPYKVIYSYKDLDDVPVTNKAISIDLETTGLDAIRDKIVGIGICFNTYGYSIYIPYHLIGEDDKDIFILEWLDSILSNPETSKVFHNGKFDIKFLKANGFEVNGICEDTMLMHYILEPHTPHNLKHLAQTLLGIYYDDYNTTVKGRSILEVPTEELAKYCCMDAYSTLQLFYYLNEHLEDKLWDVYKLERKVMLVLIEMELQGILVSGEACEIAGQKLEERMKEISNILTSICETNFNISSPQQVSYLLFELRKLSTEGIPETTKGYSVAEGVLKYLLSTLEEDSQDRQIISWILEHRKLSKLKSTYADKVVNLLHEDGKLRGEFNQAVTLTGRLSSSKPNMQNFPKNFRFMFLPNPGHLLIAADYSQCEIRLLAYLSQEEALIEAFLQNRDVHAEVAKVLLGKKDITEKERYMGKQLNLAIGYGMEALKLALSLGISIESAKELLDNFWKKLPKVAEFLYTTHQKAIANGYTETILGRRRYYSFIDDKVNSYRGKPFYTVPLKAMKPRMHREDLKELREAGNAPIQGSNADITKLAMVACKENLKYFDCHLLLQVHDELVFTCRKEDLMDCSDIIKDTMEGVYNIGIPLKVDVKFGLNWSNLHDL